MATYIPGVTDIFPEPSLFTPDFSFMDKMLQRRQGMYEQGFAQVNNKYKFIARDVTNPKNLEVRDNFLRQAKTNLKDLSSMDLSDQQNVMSATSVFEPFVNNQNVIGDQALTEHWKSQESVADSFRLKDGGKEFSEDNINYVRLQKQAFAQDDPNKWSSYYQGRRSFTPFYDYKKEWREMMKEFKPDSVEDFKMSGFYFVTEKDASVRPDAVKRFLEAGMSDKARQQIKIEASVRYGSNPQVVAGIYSQVASSKIKDIDQNIGELNVTMKMQKDPAKRNEITKLISELEDAKDTYKTSLDKVKAGDVGFLKSKADEIAYDVYYDQLVNETSKAFSRKDYKRDISVNSAAVDIWKDGQTWARQKDDQEFKMREKAKEDGGFGLATVTLPGGEDDIIQRNFSQLNDKYQTAKGNLSQVTQRFNDYILRYYKNDGVSDANDQLTTDDLMKYPKKVEDFISSHRGLKDVETYLQSSFPLNAKVKAIEETVQAARANVNNALTPTERKVMSNYIEQTKSLGDVVLRVGSKQVRYTADQIARGVLDGTVTTRSLGNVSVITIDNKEYILNPRSTDPGMRATINKVNTIINSARGNKDLNKVMTSYSRAVDDYFVNNVVLSDRANVLGDDSKAAKGIASIIQGMIGVKADIVGIKQSPSTNRTYFNISAPKDAQIQKKSGEVGTPTEEDYLNILKTQLESQGIKVGKTKLGQLYIESEMLIKNSIYRDYTQQERDMSEIDAYQTQSQFWFPLGRTYTVDPTTKSTYKLPAFRYEKTLTPGPDGTKAATYYLYDDLGGAPLASYDNLHDLIIQAKALSSDLRSYVAIKKNTQR
jgi:hypothetical protein